MYESPRCVCVCLNMITRATRSGCHVEREGVPLGDDRPPSARVC